MTRVVLDAMQTARSKGTLLHRVSYEADRRTARRDDQEPASRADFGDEMAEIRRDVTEHVGGRRAFVSRTMSP